MVDYQPCLLHKMKRINNKKAAMEMSVGTIVTIVLLMSVLVLGIFLVQKIFKSSSSAIDTVDSQIQSEINKLFSTEGKALVIYPSSREISVKKGDTPKGFAFSVKNTDVESHDFSYAVESQDTSSCGSLTTDQANTWMLSAQGSFSLGPGGTLTNAEKVLFKIPDSAPPCTIVYRVNIDKESTPYESSTIFVTIK